MLKEIAFRVAGWDPVIVALEDYEPKKTETSSISPEEKPTRPFWLEKQGPQLASQVASHALRQRGVGYNLVGGIIKSEINLDHKE